MELQQTGRTWTDFVNDVNDEFIYPLLREYLIHYLRNFERFSAHYNNHKVKKWLSSLRKYQDITSIISICEEMMSEMYVSGEFRMQYDYAYMNTAKFLFGGMYGMNRDYISEIGFKEEELDFIFMHQTPSYQRFQLQMCHELFWGWKGFGKQDLNTEDDYKGFTDDIYTTISSSPFTKYYLAAIKNTYEMDKKRIFTTIINIIVHAYHYVIDQRNDQEKIINPQQPTLVWQNLWCDFIRDECFNPNSKFISNNIYDLVWINEEELIPKGLLD